MKSVSDLLENFTLSLLSGYLNSWVSGEGLLGPRTRYPGAWFYGQSRGLGWGEGVCMPGGWTRRQRILGTRINIRGRPGGSRLGRDEGRGGVLHLPNTHARTHIHTLSLSLTHIYTLTHTHTGTYTPRAGSVRLSPRPTALRDQHPGQRQPHACGGGVRAGPAPRYLSGGSCLATEQVGATGTPSLSPILISIPREMVCVCARARVCGGGDTGRDQQMEWEGWSLKWGEWDLETGVETKSQREGRSRQWKRVRDPGRLRSDNRQRPDNPDGGAARSRRGDGPRCGVERGMEAEAVTRTGVKTELRVRGRDKQAEKDVGAQPRQQGSRPPLTFPARVGEGGQPESSLPGPDVEGGASLGRVDRRTGKAASSPSSLVRGIRV